MESLWETVYDLLITLLKAFVIFLCIRFVLMIVDVHFTIPYFDDLILHFWDSIKEAIPRIDSP